MRSKAELPVGKELEIILQALDLQGKELIARRAKRSIYSAVAAILTAGFSLIAAILFFFGDRTFLPLSEMLGIRPTVMWLCLSALIAIVWAVLHFKIMGPKYAMAKHLDGALKHRYQNKRKSEIDEKLAKLEIAQGKEH